MAKNIVAKRLINTCTGYDNGVLGVIEIQKQVDSEGNLSKIMKLMPDPNFHFYVSKTPLEIYNTSIEEDNTRRVDCKYSKLLLTIAKETNREKEFKEANRSKERYKEMKKMHYHKDVHSSDVNIQDYLIREYSENNPKPDIKNLIKLDKAYFDIEVKASDYEGFPRPEVAPCPINFISYVYNKRLELFILHDPSNKSMAKFIKENAKGSGIEWNVKNNKWCRKALKKYFIIEGDENNSLEEVNVHWFSKEINLIKNFFEMVFDDKPDFIGGWNTYFDLKTIETRISLHGIDPSDIMCPPEFKLKKVNIKEDNYSADLADKADTLEINGWSQWLDLKYVYASIRKGQGKKESLALGDILLEELGEGKTELKSNVVSEVFVDFENFTIYSGFDSYRLMNLENKNLDINLLDLMSNLTFTRHSKVMRKTVSIRNLGAVYFKSRGLILSNNQNNFIEHADFGKFKGALTAISAR